MNHRSIHQSRYSPYHTTDDPLWVEEGRMRTGAMAIRWKGGCKYSDSSMNWLLAYCASGIV